MLIGKRQTDVGLRQAWFALVLLAIPPLMLGMLIVLACLAPKWSKLNLGVEVRKMPVLNSEPSDSLQKPRRHKLSFFSLFPI